MKKLTLHKNLEIVRISSKGQLVLPKSLREKLDLEKGSFVAVTNIDGTIILKKIKGLTKEDYETLLKIEEAWKGMEKGKYKKWKSEKEFLEHLKKL